MKEGRKICLITIFSITTMGIFAQKQIYENPSYGPDSASRMECAKNLSSMSESAKIKQFDMAYEPWSAVYNDCPGASKNIYIQGAKILEHKIKNAANDEEKNKYIDLLMEMYDKRIENFKQEGYVLGRKAIDLLEFRSDDIQKSYEMFKRSVELSKSNTEDAVFATYIQTSYLLYKNDIISAEEFADNYFTVVENAEKKIATDKKPEQTQKVLETVEKIFMDSKAPTCEMLVNYFGPKFETTPNDVAVLKKVTGYLREFDCMDSELFANAAENLFQQEPSAESAYNLAKLFFTKKESDKSVEYYKKSIDLEQDNNLKAKYNYELAAILLAEFSKYSEARSYALEAINLRENWGDPYILIGNIYAASSKSCGENKFQQSAVFWAAVDKYYKAKSIDAEVEGRANELINRYSQYFPNNEDAFFYGFTDGQTYSIDYCWINETTKVRTVKK